eukprot:TRINITY_DN18799_c0_g1_i1.p1 TRINITY_DN18799_c0_g1~~TRINITY_DN18799_c0_g1_i1.p1  ORF type:complete len:463 (-),score=80.24 TRINITY_DN18799_c0_g1_i1:22-1389(-)
MAMAKVVETYPRFCLKGYGTIPEAPLHTWEELRKCINECHARSVIEDSEEYHKYNREQLPGLQQALEWHVVNTAGFDWYGTVLPRIQRWANSSAMETLPVSQQGIPSELEVSRANVRSILSRAFFCNMRCYADQIAHLKLPQFRPYEWGVMDWFLLYGTPLAVSVARIKCWLAYFYVMAKQPDDALPGTLMFCRRVLDGLPGGVPHVDWAAQTNTYIGEVIIHPNAMEQPDASSFVDFANQDLHIGTIIPSATQEEVLFSVRPELFLGLLISQRMLPKEAIIIAGAPQLIGYRGYADSFRYKKVMDDRMDLHNFPPQTVVAIDAAMEGQFTMDVILRDLDKAYVGFTGLPPCDKTISTGDWGCGAFGGDYQLKWLQQVMAAAVAGKILFYSVFHKQQEWTELGKLKRIIDENHLSVAVLYGILAEYGNHPMGDFHIYLNEALGKAPSARLTKTKF